MILLLVRAAHALDGHGAPAVPSPGSGPAAPVLVWEAGAPPIGFALTAEGARRLALAWPVAGGEPTPVLDDLVGFTLGGSWRFGRVGVTASMPLWQHYVGPDGPHVGFFPGDLRLAVPVTLWDNGGVAIGLRAEGVAPTGADDALLGGGWGGGLHATVGRAGPGWTWTLGAGITGDTAAAYDNVDRTVTLPLAGQVGFGGAVFGAGLEAWLSPSLSTTYATWSSSPGEALARVGARLDNGLSFTLAGGYAVAPGIGSAGGRALLRVGWSEPARDAKATPVATKGPPTPTDIVVSARDTAGKAVDATVTAVRMRPGAHAGDAVTGAEADVAVAPVRLGRDGGGVATLAAGTWAVTVGAPGRETQIREVTIADDAWRPAALDAVLPPGEGGTADLTVRVVDARGAPVAGAEVRIDGTPRGATSTGGTLTLVDLAAGDRTLAVTAPAYVPAEPLVIPLGAEDTVRTVVLTAPPGTVEVLARVGSAPAHAAQVRFIGPGEPRPPIALGDDGAEVVTLPPGTWVAVVTAPSLGVQEREVLVEPGSVAVLLVDVRLAGEAGAASLGVRVLDPAGNTVDGAEVLLDGVSVGRTSSGGALRVGGLAPGDHTLAAVGPLLRPAAPRTLALAGPRDVDVVLGWAPGTLAIHARGPDGEPVDAAVRFTGRASQPADALGADGQALYTLPAGDWRVAVSAPSFGLQERAVRVEPDAEARIDIDAALLREAGDAGLVLRVRGPDGVPVAGARVRVDGRDAGTIGGTGDLALSGLAPGKHRVDVDGAEAALGTWTRELTLASGENPVEARLAWADRAVRVRAVGPDGPLPDAVARAYGPGERPAVPLGPDAEALFALDTRPGWAVAASSGTWGLTSAPVPTGKANPALLDLRFAPPTPGTARLLLEVRGPDGALVHGARVTAGAAEHSVPDGWLLLPEVAPGPLALRVTAPGFVTGADELDLVEGAQERRLRLAWKPRAVVVRVVDVAGAPVDAQVRLAGPSDVRPGSTGADGNIDATVLPGDWQVLVSAPAYGARSVAAPVPPGDDPHAVTVTLDAARVAVTDGAVRVDDAIHFAFDEATIQADSFRVLEEVAAALQLHPEVTRVEIQGHTDDRGDPVYNLDLSQRRAEAVRAWLVERGVAAGRLVAKGYGASSPLATNATDAGRRANRRVQLVIQTRE